MDGEEPVAVVSKKVQSSASKASGASLAGQTFGAALSCDRVGEDEGALPSAALL